MIKTIANNHGSGHIQKTNNNEEYIPSGLKKVAEGMEAQFIEHLISEMQKTVQKNSPNSPSLRIYNSMLRTEQAREIAAQGSKNGLMIRKMILDQVYPQNMRNEATYNHFENPNKNNNHFQNVKKYSPQKTKGHIKEAINEH